jgi:molecular chaperone GrpE
VSGPYGDRSDELGQEPPVVRDKRRIDPTTGAVREQTAGSEPGGPAPGGADAPVPGDGAVSDVDETSAGGLEAQLAERTADLQRLHAEYANYRKRVERDRALVAENAVASVLIGLLPVLDDIGRAREHGELEGGFKAVAEALEATVEKLGLVRFGEPGEPFDPNHHEAPMHQGTSADVTVPTAVLVLQPGYRIASATGERVLRPARVAVADPEQ